MASQFVTSISQFCHQTATRNNTRQQGCCSQYHVKHQTKLQKSKNDYSNCKIKILDNCWIKISQYSFLYNGEGGGGTGSLIRVQESRITDKTPRRFKLNLRTVHIPPLTNRTAKFDQWFPFPSSLKVDVVPENIQADIYEESGKVEIHYRAKLCLSIGSSYKAPPLLVDMILTTEEVKKALNEAPRGKRLDKQGQCRLVGIAKIDPTDDKFINSVFDLPTMYLMSLNAIISFY